MSRGSELEGKCYLICSLWMIFCFFLSYREGLQFKEIIHLYNLAIGMEVNGTKYTMLTLGLEENQDIEFG